MLRLTYVVVGLALIVAMIGGQHHVLADLSSCSASLSPQTVAPGSDNYFVFGITDTDPNDITWVQITSPGGQYFTVESAGAYQWQGNNDSNSATFTQGDLSSGSSWNFSVEALTSDTTTSSPIDWQVQASDDPGGANPITCGGDLSLTIVQPATQISITGIGVTDVSSGGATITWTTNAASTSQVDYGPDSTYGSSTTTDNTLVTSHSVTLTRLTANTGYHFQVVSTTPDGGNANSGDNTLLTAIVQTTQPPVTYTNPSSTSPSSGNSSNNNPIGITITNRADNTPPKISFTNLPTVKVFKTAPTLTGQASDSVAVQRVEYSTDNGQNWLPVNNAPKLNTAQTTFSFTPVNLPDGTYKFMARAVNDGGYITATPTVTIVIDSLPPIVGGNILALGPQVLVPNSNGVITSIAGVDQKITMSSVGGPTSIDLTAQKIGANTSSAQAFGLTESQDTLLWSGIVSIASQGKYRLVANAIDGAGVKTTQVVGAINITSDPHIYNQVTHQPVPSIITLYYLDPDSHSWVVWDGNSYNQTNPQTTDSHGNFKLFVPPGTYYLQATAPGYETLISSIFKTSQSEPLTTNLGLKPLHQLSLGPVHLSLPTLAIQNVNLNPRSNTTLSGTQSSLVGQPLSDFTLIDTDGSTVHTADLLGKPTLITLGSTWAPTMDEQLSILSRLQANQNLNIIPIALQQNAGQVEAYTSIAGLNLNWLVDPDSTLTPEFGAPNLPTQLFVDRNGIVKQVYVGDLSQSQIMDTLSGLE